MTHLEDSLLVKTVYIQEECRMYTECYAGSLWTVFSGMEGKNTQRERRDIKSSKQDSGPSFIEVAFIPQLKSLLWQIARFTVCTV